MTLGANTVTVTSDALTHQVYRQHERVYHGIVCKILFDPVTNMFSVTAGKAILDGAFTSFAMAERAAHAYCNEINTTKNDPNRPKGGRPPKTKED